MAEIRSTMDMVMERAARMGGDAGSDLEAEEKIKAGMRAGAGYLRSEVADLAKFVSSQAESDRSSLVKGITQALLRNIALPRESDQQSVAETAMNGLVQVGQGSGELLAVFGDMKKVLDQYLQHRQQLRQQLEDGFAQQMGQMQDNVAKQTGMNMKLDPSQHPKFQEEWHRLQAELNDHYGKALDQYKQMVEQLLSR
ncbi:MAG: hypothetical protein KKB30_13200 [Proteobacteria bacterium]|nr:hypothetical protein [Pseudomonadota bacterium]MBU1716832.1 hypothetical protein [Pseudomonadota bacterium]